VEIIAALDPIKASLDTIESASRGVSNDQTLVEAIERLAPVRDQLRDEIDILERRLAEADKRLKEIGDPPPATAPPEDPALAAERTRLNGDRSGLDATLKQARLVALRADQLNSRLNQRRRNLLTNRLTARSAGLLTPAFWRDSADGAVAEVEAARD